MGTHNGFASLQMLRVRVEAIATQIASIVTHIATLDTRLNQVISKVNAHEAKLNPPATNGDLAVSAIANAAHNLLHPSPCGAVSPTDSGHVCGRNRGHQGFHWSKESSTFTWR